MNFMRTNTKISLLEDYYSHFNEDHRLQTRHGQVEFITNINYINKYLNEDKSKKILDIAMGLEGMPRQASTHACRSSYYKRPGYRICSLIFK